MKRLMIQAGLAVVTGCGVSIVRGGDVYSTGFENPPFVSGSALVGQDGWVGFSGGPGAPTLNPNAAVVTSGSVPGPASGQQYIRVAGSSLVSEPQVAPYDAVGSWRKPVNFDSTVGGQSLVSVKADVRLDGPQTPLGSDLVASNLAARSASGPVGELEISSDGRVNGYTATDSQTPGSSPTFSAPITLGAYHSLEIDVDFARQQYSFLVDGSALGTPVAFNADSGFSTTLARGSINAYSRADAAGRAAYTYSFDNFSITSTPEPGALGLVTLTAVGLGRRRRAIGRWMQAPRAIPGGRGTCRA